MQLQNDSKVHLINVASAAGGYLEHEIRLQLGESTSVFSIVPRARNLQEIQQRKYKREISIRHTRLQLGESTEALATLHRVFVSQRTIQN